MASKVSPLVSKLSDFLQKKNCPNCDEYIDVLIHE